MKEKRTDIFGVTPDIGDLIVYNPPVYKGLVIGTCVGFTSVGLPKLKIDRDVYSFYLGQSDKNDYYTPKTGFVVKKTNKNEIK